MTRDGELQSGPRFSPDGGCSAFTRSVGDQQEVFVIDSFGADLRRVTWRPRDDRLLGWTPDGNRLLITSERLSHASLGAAKRFTISIAGGLPDPLPMEKGFWADFSPMASVSPKRPIQDAFATWKRYGGCTTPPVWFVDLRDWTHVEVPHVGASDTHSDWLADDMYFRSDRDGAMRVCRYDERSARVEQIAGEGNVDIDAMAGDARTLVLSHAEYLHAFDVSSRHASRLSISVLQSPESTSSTEVDASALIQSATLGTDGERVAFEARGEIFVVRMDGSNPVNVTRSPVQVERSPIGSVDCHRMAYPADVEGEYRLFVRSASESTCDRRVQGDLSCFLEQMQSSPDGTRIAFVNRRFELYWVTLRDLPARHSPVSILPAPKSMLTNTEAGSGGDVCPCQAKPRKHGTLIGTRTWGGVNCTYRGAQRGSLVDSGSAFVSDLGTYAADGAAIVASVGVQSDIVFAATPADVAAGRDTQLERAVFCILEQLEARPTLAEPALERMTVTETGLRSRCDAEIPQVVP